MVSGALKLLLVLILGACVLLSQQVVADAGDGCEYEPLLNTCIDTLGCCDIPGQCQQMCRVFDNDHCHCVPIG
jgi:hypothetical protein